MARIWAHSQRKDGELLVMLALADFANDAGESWPSIPILAQKARLTERQTRKVLAKLEAAGEIRRVRSNGGRNRRNHYFINLSENPEIKTLNKKQRKNNPVFGDTKTLSPATGALNRHRTVSMRARQDSHLNGHHKERKAPESYKETVALYVDLFVGRVGAKPDFDGRDGKLLSGLLKAHGAAEVQELLRFFFAHPPTWVEKTSKFTIYAFKSAYTELLAQSRSRQARMGVL
jgi:hypothetical protein